MKGRTLLAAALIAVVALAAGAAATWLYLEPSRRRLEDQASDARTSLAEGSADLRFQWAAQLLYLRSSEATHLVNDGVYLAKISPVGDSGYFWADWEGTDGMWTGRVSNKSRFRQKLQISPFGEMLVLSRIPGHYELLPGPPSHEVPVLGPKAASNETFFRDLASDTSTGTALRNAHWWVTVQVGHVCRLLVEASPR